jgi:hypothetical protein
MEGGEGGGGGQNRSVGGEGAAGKEGGANHGGHEGEVLELELDVPFSWLEGDRRERSKVKHAVTLDLLCSLKAGGCRIQPADIEITGMRGGEQGETFVSVVLGGQEGVGRLAEELTRQCDDGGSVLRGGTVTCKVVSVLRRGFSGAEQ